MKHNLNIVWKNNEAPEGNRYYEFSITIIINEITRLRRESIHETRNTQTKEGAIPLNIYASHKQTKKDDQNRNKKILNFFYPQT
jgi:hypothetical protein